MKLPRVAELERENAGLREGWRHDLGVLVSLAERVGDTKTAQAARDCLKKL